LFFSTWDTWADILTGFVRFGSIPTEGDQLQNVFVALWRGESLPVPDLKTIGLLASLVAIAGQGGLSNTPLSNYTRDQGWGMGHHVGAIPSVFGGRNISLSHVGMVFEPTAETLPRWRRWYRHLMRDQLCVWMPACFVGLALPSMLSIQFLPRGTQADKWAAAGMTADGVRNHVGADWGNSWGQTAWYLTLFCGFLVLAPTMASTIDGIVRRWVDVFWTSSARLRQWKPQQIGRLYSFVLVGYSAFGLTMLALGEPLQLLVIASNILNFALGFSCLHTLYVNVTLLPRPLRPCWAVRIALVLTGIFFLTVASIQAYETLRKYEILG
jgi:hypothetical protein